MSIIISVNSISSTIVISFTFHYFCRQILLTEPKPMNIFQPESINTVQQSQTGHRPHRITLRSSSVHCTSIIDKAITRSISPFNLILKRRAFMCSILKSHQNDKCAQCKTVRPFSTTRYRDVRVGPKMNPICP